MNNYPKQKNVIYPSKSNKKVSKTDKIQMIDMEALKILCKAYDKDPEVNHSTFSYPGAAFYTYCEIRIEAAEKKIEDELVETLAALEHEQWAHWTEFMLFSISGENIKRWQRQIKTPYRDLSEEEKESDRIWARKVLGVLNRAKEESGNDKIADFDEMEKDVVFMHTCGLSQETIASHTGVGVQNARDIIKEYEDEKR